MKKILVCFVAALMLFSGIVWASKSTSSSKVAVLKEIGIGEIVIQDESGAITAMKAPQIIEKLIEEEKSYVVVYEQRRWGRPVVQSIEPVNLEEGSQNANSSLLHSPTGEPTEAMFNVDMQIPDRIEAGQPFEVEGSLVNLSDRDWEISHGAAMFTYSVFNDNGEPVPREDRIIAVNDIGLGTTLQPNKKYRYDGEGHVSVKLYELTIKNPGSYRIVGQAEFRIVDDNKSYELGIKSDPQDIVVE